MNIGWAIFQLVASYLISLALTPKPQDAKATAFKDIDFPQADEGTPQAVIFGDCWTGDWMVLAVGNYRVDEIHASGGKK
jgi:hypothetical protein